MIDRCGRRPPDAAEHDRSWCHLPPGHDGPHAYVECGTKPKGSPFYMVPRRRRVKK